MSCRFILLIFLCVANICNAQGIRLHDSVMHVQIPVKPRYTPAVVKPVVPHMQVAVLSFSSSFINPGFFCRQEVKMDRKLPLPLRFRLGSLQYCNWLEQKPGYTNWPQ
ncbi:hypothetical protein ACTHGU_06035 [Chitinophagaceae bacterium MMS25-I14]